MSHPVAPKFRVHHAMFIRIKLQGARGWVGGSSAGWVGLKLWTPLTILRVSWVGLLPPLLSLLIGALSSCLLVPLSALSLCRHHAKNCGCGVFVGSFEQAQREHLKGEKYKQWVKAKKSQRPLNFPEVSPVQPKETSTASSSSSSRNNPAQSSSAAQSGTSA